MNAERTRKGPKDLDAQSRGKHPVIEGAARAWQSLPSAEPDSSLIERVGDRVIAQISMPLTKEARPRQFPSAAVGMVALAAAAAVALLIVLPRLSTNEGGVVESTPAHGAHEASPPVVAKKETKVLAPEFVGSAVAISGQASLLRGGGMPSQLTTDRKVAKGDLFQLGPDAEVEISMPGVARFQMSPDTVLELGGQERTAVLDLRRGSVTVEVDPRGVGDGFFVTTPAGRVEVTGTIFKVDVSRNAAVKVEVAEGTVVVRDMADTRSAVKVSQGFGLNLDWSDPTPKPLDSQVVHRIISRFAVEKPAENTPPRPAADSQKRWEKLFDKAQALRSSHRPSEALKVYRRIAREAPSRNMKAEAWFAIAQVRYSTGDKEGAQKDLESHSALFAGTPFEKMARLYLAKIRGKESGSETGPEETNREITQ